MLDPQTSIELAEQVAGSARVIGIDSALIGAAALAVHRYTRATEDIDLAVATDPHRGLAELERRLLASGLRTRLRLPDDDDPLGGVLTVWRSHETDDPVDVVEVVNFSNPSRPMRTPANSALARAQWLSESGLKCVTLEDLVAFKLYAGGQRDHADIALLLANNPNADLARVRAAAEPFDRSKQLEALIAHSLTLRPAQRY